MQTVAYGIRNEDYPDARYSEMPAFGRDELLSEEEIQQATHFVLSLSGSDHDAELASAGAEVYDYNCSSCHGVEGNGDPFMGAPRAERPDLALWWFGRNHLRIDLLVTFRRYAGFLTVACAKPKSALLRPMSTNWAAASNLQFGSNIWPGLPCRPGFPCAIQRGLPGVISRT